MKESVRAEYITRVHADYFQYYVCDKGQSAEVRYPEETTGLADLAEGGGIKVTTGAQTGSISLTVLLLSEPPQAEIGDWDEIVELGYAVPDGSAQVLSFPYVPLPGSLVLSHAGPGAYRIRFHARGRDDPRNQDPHPIVEEHMIVVWPGELSPTITVYKATDECGKRWREAARIRRGR